MRTLFLCGTRGEATAKKIQSFRGTVTTAATSPPFHFFHLFLFFPHGRMQSQSYVRQSLYCLLFPSALGAANSSFRTIDRREREELSRSSLKNEEGERERSAEVVVLLTSGGTLQNASIFSEVRELDSRPDCRLYFF